LTDQWVKRGLELARCRKPSLPLRPPSVAYEDVSFPSAHADGVALSGWLLPCPDARGVVLLCHGIHSTRQRMLTAACMLRRHGFATLLFDFRGRGQSGGAFCTFGTREVDDIRGAVDYIKSRPELRDLPLGALGESLGAASLVLAMERDPRISAAVLEACFLSFERAVYHRVRWALRTGATRGVAAVARVCRDELGIDIAPVSPIDAIASLSPRPLLLIHDLFDWSCPRGDFDQLLARAGPPKERWIAVAPHVCAARWSPKTYESRVASFFERHLA
jgi:pimeloyl-ACP methyl ester carboxylesterase